MVHPLPFRPGSRLAPSRLSGREVDWHLLASTFSLEFHAIPPYKDRFFLHQKYVVERLSIAQISTQIFSSREAVRRGLMRIGIPLRDPHKPHGNPGQPPYGQRKVRARPVVKHAGEERVIGAIIDMKKQGLSFRQIASFLSKIGVPTKRKGKAWHPEMVKRIYIRELTERSGRFSNLVF